MVQKCLKTRERKEISLPSAPYISRTLCRCVWERGLHMYLCVSGPLVGFLETGRFLKDHFLQLLLGIVIQFHGEVEGLLCYRLHANKWTEINQLNIDLERLQSYRRLQLMIWRLWFQRGWVAQFLTMWVHASRVKKEVQFSCISIETAVKPGSHDYYSTAQYWVSVCGDARCDVISDYIL